MNAFKTLEVSELFGPTFQGEGRSLGKLAVFLRLRRCNLQCQWAGGNLCDAFYTWKKDDVTYQHGYKKMTLQDVAAQMKARMGGHEGIFVISGGEPLLWKSQLVELIPMLGDYQVEFETNGTIHPEELSDFWNVSFNVSPKLSSAGNEGLRTIGDLVIFAGLSEGDRAIFKFVVTRDRWEQDVAEIEALQKQFSLNSRYIYVMPEGITGDQITVGMKQLAQPVLERGWNLTTRLHILIWGNERAR